MCRIQLNHLDYYCFYFTSICTYLLLLPIYLAVLVTVYIRNHSKILPKEFKKMKLKKIHTPILHFRIRLDSFE